MNKYVYSASNNVFFPALMLADYEVKGWDLSDVKEVEQGIYDEYRDAPAGKVRAAGNDGFPVWEDIPLPTKEEYIALADTQVDRLIEEATQKITVWQTKLLRGRKLADAEAVELDSWLDYIDELNAVDTTLAPDITLPVAPV